MAIEYVTARELIRLEEEHAQLEQEAARLWGVYGKAQRALDDLKGEWDDARYLAQEAANNLRKVRNEIKSAPEEESHA